MTAALTLTRPACSRDPDQESVGVDAVGRTGHQRHIVFAGIDLHQLHVFRENDVDLIHLIGVFLSQDEQGEPVARPQLVQLREQLGGGKSPVSGDHRMGAFAAHGKRAPLQVARGDLQNGVAGAVVDTEIALDGGDLDIPHHAGAVEIQLGFILGKLVFLQQTGRTAFLRPVPVVFLRGYPDPFQLVVGQDCFCMELCCQ